MVQTIKKGYKQTEVGVIPEDWNTITLEKLTTRIGDGIHSTPQYNDNGEYYFVNGNNLVNGEIKITEETKRVAKDEFLNHKRELGNDTVLMSINGTIGNIAFYSGENILIGKSAAYININEKLDKKYFYQLLQANLIKKYFENELTGSTIKNLGLSIIRNTPIPLPPTKAEQTAIANALSDMDDLINSLSTLIEKKKAIKQGAMQQLLKPKEGWVEISILQLADNKKELFDDGDWIEAEHITNEGIRLIQTGNIGVGCYEEKDTKKYINETSFYKLKCKELRLGDLLICRLAEPAGRACVLPDIGENKIITSVDVTIFRPRLEVANRIFLANIFSTNEWFETISGMSGGTTHKRISRGSLGRIKLSIPSIEEQNRIAYILSDMDIEIHTLEQNLSKYQMLKQGMMQELLTGKTRLLSEL